MMPPRLSRQSRLSDQGCLATFGDRRAPDGSLVRENFEAWFGSSCIVDPAGAPLVVYHGTDTTFERFESRAPVTVHYLDGQEVQRADSWDMGEDRQGCAHGYHYGALCDAQILGAAQALESRQAEASRLNLIGPDTLRAIADLRRMVGKTYMTRVESRPTADGFYFTADTGYSFVRDIHKCTGGNVVPVYLRLTNPAWVNASEIEGAGASFRIERYVAAGHDGVIFADYPNDLRQRGWNGSSQIVVFDACQIKSAIGNSGLFDPDSDDFADAHAWDAPVLRERMRA